MKKLPLIILLLAAAACSSKKNTTGASPVPAVNSNTITVSMERVGDLVIDTPKQAVEELLRQKLVGLSNDSSAVYFPDTVSCRYKGVDYTLTFQKHQDYGDSNFTITLARVKSQDARLRTSTGVGIGDSLSGILKAYDGSGCTIHIAPVTEAYPGEPARAKGSSEVTVSMGERGNSIVFYLANYKVQSMEACTHIEGD